MDLTNLGILHTILAVIALGCAGLSLRKHGEIRRDSPGLTYIATTALTALSALFIFRQGSFGPGHVLAILTIIALIIGWFAPRLPQRWSRDPVHARL